MADPHTGSPPDPGASAEQDPAASLTKFDRDTAVWLQSATDGSQATSANGAAGKQTVFAAQVAPDWRAGRGPHGGYLAAMLLRALIESVDDASRPPRSLTIHYARAPAPGAVRITTTLERAGRSLSTLSARMHQDEHLIALVLAAFSLPWGGPEIATARMPAVEPPDPSRESVALIDHGGPEFAHHLVLQPRMQGRPFSGPEQPMQIRCWIGLAEPRPIDALGLAFFSDALVPAPYMRMSELAAVPTVDLTVHFRARMTPQPGPDPRELCLAQTSSQLVHDGFFVEDGMIWAADGTLLAHSRQLAIVIPLEAR